MTIKRHEPSQILSKVVEANGFVFTAGITAALASGVLMLTGRLMFSVALVAAFCALIATAASVKRATMIWLTRRIR